LKKFLTINRKYYIAYLLDITEVVLGRKVNNNGQQQVIQY